MGDRAAKEREPDDSAPVVLATQGEGEDNHFAIGEAGGFEISNMGGCVSASHLGARAALSFL
jgi:hypothetical protein